MFVGYIVVLFVGFREVFLMTVDVQDGSELIKQMTEMEDINIY